jgi:hypothetical protein
VESSPDTKEMLPGVTLTRSTLGGFSVEYRGRYIGWIHASIGQQWNAYQRSTTPNAPSGIPLGSFSNKLEAVREIAKRSGWTE